jgi:hypothetical protein
MENIKYPRTAHLPQSPGATSDDKFITSDGLAVLRASTEFLTTEKMDGGNVTMTRNHFFARSLDSGTHAWDTPAKALWASVRYQIPEGWRVSGESLYARRSVGYDSLPGFYMVFGVWDENDNLLDWEFTEEFAKELGLPTVPVLYRGDSFDDAVTVWSKTMNTDVSEGFVVRDAGTIAEKDFRSKVGKWVRSGHVTTSADWRHRDDFDLNVIASE